MATTTNARAAAAQAKLKARMAQDTANQTSSEEKAKSVLWLNIGYEHPTLGFISLPFNLSLDNMKDAEIRGNTEMRQRAVLKNLLLKDLRELVKELDVGHENALVLDAPLQIQAYHAATEAEANPEDEAELVSTAVRFGLSK